MKIYISGRIAGLTKEDYERNFDYAETSIAGFGHEPVNPVKVLPFQSWYEWQDYMRADIKALMDCDAVYAMSNHKESKGAMIEVKLARDLGLRVYYKLEDLPLAF